MGLTTNNQLCKVENAKNMICQNNGKDKRSQDRILKMKGRIPGIQFQKSQSRYVLS